MPESSEPLGWTVVVPVKSPAVGKSRLAGLGPVRARLARAMALDTVDAASRTPGVVQVLVVTPDDEVAATASAMGALPVADPGGGLVAAVEAGIAAARTDLGVAVLLGDLPALRPDELSSALRSAARHGRAMVPDADGTGTTLITASPGHRLRVRFGPGSAAAHGAAGHVTLVRPVDGLRCDVDDEAGLAQAALLGLGPRTAAVWPGSGRPRPHRNP